MTYVYSEELDFICAHSTQGMDYTYYSCKKCSCKVSSVALQYVNLSNLCTIFLLSTSSYM